MLSQVPAVFENRPTVRKILPRLAFRPIRPNDAPALQVAFQQLSQNTRYLRFHSGMARLPDSLLRYLTEVDGIHHVALVAFERKVGVAVGRFVRDRALPTTAEVAITVADEAQGRGVGRRVLVELAEEARSRGIETFTASVLSANTRARKLLAGLGAVAVGSASGVISFQLAVTELSAAA